MTDRVLVCRETGTDEGNTHVVASGSGTVPLCGPWWKGREKETLWQEVTGRVSCAVCLRMLGDQPRRRKVVLHTVSPKSSRTPLIHLADPRSGRPTPECGPRCVVDAEYRRVPADTLVTCSHCLGTAQPRGRKRK